MEVIAHAADVEMNGLRYEITLALADEYPPDDAIVTALVFGFRGEDCLLTRLVERGWDLPGGHREPGETPEQTARREFLEETGAELGDLHLFAHQCIRLLSPRPKGHRYPDAGYQVFYLGQVTTVGTLVPTAEAIESRFFTPVEMAEIERPLELFEPALRIWRDIGGAPSEPEHWGAVVNVYRRRGADVEFLIIHRSGEGADYEGDWAWGPPAGKREHGETVEQCALREVREETGLRIASMQVVGPDPWRFAAEVPFDTNIVLSDEHDKYAWVSCDEAVARCLPSVVGHSFLDAARQVTTHDARSA